MNYFVDEVATILKLFKQCSNLAALQLHGSNSPALDIVFTRQLGNLNIMDIFSGWSKLEYLDMSSFFEYNINRDFCEPLKSISDLLKPSESNQLWPQIILPQKSIVPTKLGPVLDRRADGQICAEFWQGFMSKVSLIRQRLAIRRPPSKILSWPQLDALLEYLNKPLKVICIHILSIVNNPSQRQINRNRFTKVVMRKRV